MWSGTTGSAFPPGTATHVQKRAWSGPVPIMAHRNGGGPTGFLGATRDEAHRR
jgi:hypothetical protein